MFRLRITSPGLGWRCMCKLQAGVSRGEKGRGRGRNVEIVVVTPLPDTLLLFIPITLNIGRGKYCQEQWVFSGQNDGSGPKYLRTWENIRNTRRVGYLTNDSGIGWNRTLEPWSRWSLLRVSGYQPLTVSVKNHKPIWAQIIGYYKVQIGL